MQLLGIHNVESLSESKILSSFNAFSAAEIEEGYSARAMAGRQQLLEEAKEVALKSIGKKIAAEKRKGIDLPMHLIPGAMSILTKIGEHDLVLRVGKKVLESPEAGNMERDILLSMALARLGMADNYFTIPNQVAMACTCMEGALKLLKDAGNPPLAETLTKEIEAALETYVPKCVLDQLKLPLDAENSKGRKDAIKILRGLLEVPRQVEYSHVGVDRHYVKHVMDIMTSSEILHIMDWTRVLSDPKCVKWYYPGLLLKGAGVHIVVAFLQRRPALLRDLDNLLSLPGKDREAHVEHVICKLLLGEVERAFDILDKIEGTGKLEEENLEGQATGGDGMVSAMSVPDRSAVGAKVLPGRNETLAFVKAHSNTGNGDYVPGLCLFFERWLQNAGLPQFRDTASSRPSLSLVDYFNDRKVKAYLNSSVDSRNGLSARPSLRSSGSFGALGLFGMISPNKKEEKKPHVAPPQPPEETVNSRTSFLGAASYLAATNGRPNNGYLTTSHIVPTAPHPRRLKPMWVAALGGAVMGSFLFAAFRFPWTASSKEFVETTSTVREVKEIEKPKVSFSVTEQTMERKRKRGSALPLRKKDAEKLVGKWQFAKAEALGPNHEFKYMRKVLANPMLESWSASMKEVQRRGWFYEYKLDQCKVTQMDSSHLNQPDGYVNVMVTLKESAVMYGDNGQEIDRYRSRYNVEYHVIKDVDGRWKINNYKVIKPHT